MWHGQKLKKKKKKRKKESKATAKQKERARKEGRDREKEERSRSKRREGNRKLTVISCFSEMSFRSNWSWFSQTYFAWKVLDWG